MEDDSGNNSTPSASCSSSPINDLLRQCSQMSSKTEKGNNTLPHNNALFQWQMDVFNQMNMFGLMSNPTALPLSSEMQRLILDNQIPYPPPYMQNPWAMSLMMQMGKTMPTKTFEAPLDLSVKNPTSFLLDSLLKNDSEKSTFDLDEVLGKEKNFSMKRNYSAQDLAQAVEDIRSGKLGTRRASVVYGIPRSTLRNKIYKLEATEDGINKICNKRKKPVDCDKKLENVEKKKSPTSRESSTPSSQGSNESTVFEDAKEVAESLKLNEPSNDWATKLWENLFKSHQTQMTPDVMRLGQTGSMSPKGKNNEDWKKCRPKRGQYRKYDKNALNEAVQSVRRGEMSVHRAGSYYGVPHSTLEYKVKERNLLRKKKDIPSSNLFAVETSPVTENL